MNQVSLILCLIIFTIFGPERANACGMLVHQDVTDRAILHFGEKEYKAILQKHIGYVQAGSAFPDWGYMCQSDAGEASHWPPFVEAYRSYLEETYTKGSDQYNRLAAFLFGIESHIQADVMWHWGKRRAEPQEGSDENDVIYDQQGYIHSMSKTASDCNGDGYSSTNPNCHNIADLGADFYLGGRGGTDFLKNTWKVPATDLEKIYKKMGLKTQLSATIWGCNQLMYISSILEQYLTSSVTFVLDLHSAFLTEELDLWYHSGLEDMGSHVVKKWKKLASMLDTSTGIANPESGNIQACPVFGTDFVQKEFTKYSKLVGLSTVQNKYGHTEYSFDINTVKGNSADILLQLQKDMDIQNILDNTDFDLGSFDLKTKRLIAGNQAQLYFGKSIAEGDFNGDGKTELFVGAPGFAKSGFSQQGAVYKLSMTDDKEDQGFDAADPHLTRDDDYSRFGFSMVALDVDQDGIDDLVVSAPAYGTDGVTELTDYYPKAYYGRVYIFLGSKGTGIKKNAEPDFIIQSKNETDPFFNLGLGLRVSECNGDGHKDLIVLSPMATQGGSQRGHVAVFYKWKKFKNSDKTHFIEDADFIMNGFSEYQWFGFDAVCTSSQKIFIGLPGERSSKGDYAVGAVHGYDIFKAQLETTIESNEAQSKFGQSLAYHRTRDLLAVGAPTRKATLAYHVGAVYIYDLGKKKLTFSGYEAALKAQDRGARFGKQLLWVNDTLVVSAPTLSSRYTFQVPNDQGKVYVFKKAHELTNDVMVSKAFQEFKTTDVGCRHGDALKYSDSNQLLVIGSPFCHNQVSKTQQRLAGSIFIVDLLDLTAIQQFLSAIDSVVLGTTLIMLSFLLN